MRKFGEIVSSGTEETLKFGQILAEELNAGDIVFLVGELGTGKTVIAKGIARGLGFKGIVNSPSFSLVKIYRADMTIYHCDLYRVNLDDDIKDIGIEEMIDDEDAVIIFEWSEKFTSFKRIPYWEVKIETTEEWNQRIIRWKRME